MNERPEVKYQCISRPGSCKFEWCCGPLCACNVFGPPKTAEGRRNLAEAEAMQHRWRAEDAVTKLGNIHDGIALRRGTTRPEPRIG